MANLDQRKGWSIARRGDGIVKGTINIFSVHLNM